MWVSDLRTLQTHSSEDFKFELISLLFRINLAGRCLMTDSGVSVCEDDFLLKQDKPGKHIRHLLYRQTMHFSFIHVI